MPVIRRARYIVVPTHLRVFATRHCIKHAERQRVSHSDRFRSSRYTCVCTVYVLYSCTYLPSPSCDDGRQIRRDRTADIRGEIFNFRGTGNSSRAWHRINFPRYIGGFEFSEMGMEISLFRLKRKLVISLLPDILSSIK